MSAMVKVFVYCITIKNIQKKAGGEDDIPPLFKNKKIKAS